MHMVYVRVSAQEKIKIKWRHLKYMTSSNWTWTSEAIFAFSCKIIVLFCLKSGRETLHHMAPCKISKVWPRWVKFLSWDRNFSPSRQWRNICFFFFFFFLGGGGCRPSSGEGARRRHRSEGCTIKSQMADGGGGAMGAHGVNGGDGAWPPIVTSLHLGYTLFLS